MANETQVGEELRKKNYPSGGSSMKDVVFDFETGQFSVMSKPEAAVSSGTTVNSIVEEGFA